MTRVFNLVHNFGAHSRLRRYSAFALAAVASIVGFATTALADDAGVTADVIRSNNPLKGSVKSVSDAVWQQTGADVIKLESGELLINPVNTLRVHTAHGDVFVRKNCAVLVAAEPKLSRFLVLYDTWAGGVTVTTDKRTKRLVSGSELDVIDATNTGEATQELLQDGLRRRHVKIFDEGSSHYIVSAQFSIPDAMVKQAVLSALQNSPDKSDRNMFEHMIKVAAAISMTGAPEPYSAHE